MGMADMLNLLVSFEVDNTLLTNALGLRCSAGLSTASSARVGSALYEVKRCGCFNPILV